ncbi:MAG: hypothetical protein GY754_18275 [bacterium]|nr:hypothetical protein [bacterium]
MRLNTEQEISHSDISSASEGALYSLSFGNKQFYTADPVEARNAIDIYGYRYEDLEGFIYKEKEPGTVPLLRFRDDQGHFYTTDSRDMQQALDTPGVFYEGITGYVYLFQAPGCTPLFKLHNESGEMIYTTSPLKKRDAMKKCFVYDGIICYIGREPL